MTEVTQEAVQAFKKAWAAADAAGLLGERTLAGLRAAFAEQGGVTVNGLTIEDWQMIAAAKDEVLAAAARVYDSERDTPGVWLYQHAKPAFGDHLDELCEHMSERWEDDIAQSALVYNFVEHWGAVDRALDEARAEDDYDDVKPIWFMFDPLAGGLVRAKTPSDE